MEGPEFAHNSLGMFMEFAHSIIFISLRFIPLENLSRMSEVNQGYYLENYTVQSAPYSGADLAGLVSLIFL